MTPGRARAEVNAWLQQRWYGAAPPPLVLRPLSAVYGAVVARRRAAAVRRPPKPVPVPVIVVGNLTVGGTGKTPITIWLVERLREWGWRPGVIARGYGGHAPSYPFAVTPKTSAALAGDEPVLVATRTGAPVVVDPLRRRAAEALLAGGGVDIVVADDGLQHYGLPRDLEICVIDGRRGLGNGALLPAGPLREPAARLDQVGLIAINGGGFVPPSRSPAFDFHLAVERAVALHDGSTRLLEALRGQTVHAVAGIGDPARFFSTLERHGLRMLPHPFPDHHAFAAADLRFAAPHPILMTEKDAVKCRGLDVPDLWAVPVDVVVGPTGVDLVRRSVEALKR